MPALIVIANSYTLASVQLLAPQRTLFVVFTCIVLLPTMARVASDSSQPWAWPLAGVLGLVFVWYAWRLMDPPDEMFAMKVFNYSIVYLMVLFAFLLVDHWLMPVLAPAPAMVLQPT